MNSYSLLVLASIFGTWIFKNGELSGVTGNDLTPITIFAGSYSQVGLAVFGMFTCWAMFLGIFRLRQNGNFFGAKDANEAFFYPLRVVAALTLCAPVIPVGDASTGVVLTPGHQLIVSIAKTGSEWADDTMAVTFRILHKYGIVNDPQLNVGISKAQALEQFKSWYLAATAASGHILYRNPEGYWGPFSEASEAGDKAQVLAIAASSLALNKPSGYGDFVDSVAANSGVPVLGDPASVNDGTLDRERNNQSFICRHTEGRDGIFKMFSSFSCSEEFQAARAESQRAIASGLYTIQMDAWNRIFEQAWARALVHHKNPAAGTASKSAADTQKFLQDMTDWYVAAVQAKIKDELIASRLKTAEPFYEGIEEYGWMMSSTFMLRAANDFSLAQSYSSSAVSKLAPQYELSSLTPGDDLAIMVHGVAKKDVQAASSNVDRVKTYLLDEFLNIDVLFGDDPAKSNLSTVSAWGKELAGLGGGLLAGSFVANAVMPESIAKLMKYASIPLIVIGGAIGYVLPAMFIVYGFFSVISWISYVLSAFIGVTLWGAAMAAPKGEEHSSQMAGKGWNVLAFLLLYPVLSFAGITAAIIITGIGIPLLNMMLGGLWGMLDESISGSYIDQGVSLIIGGTVYIILYAFLAWSLVTTAAQLISNFPRTVLNMIAFSEPGLSPYENVSSGVAASASGLMKSIVANPVSAIIRNRAVSGSNRSSGPQGGGQ
ncbi:hypothetical protein [Metapseudomonas otitidis]|uniref:hypothetical protein n=1 Tax=Metapseudomonas otitidis TaxID=319939 RepID=UPI0026159A96|nr:hypothetical protein [Pseudomonas otitidis]